jgi:type IV secretion system protein TrbD
MPDGHWERPEGYEVPIAGALTEPVLMAGVPRDYAILMGTIAAVLGLALKLWWLGLLWWGVAHAAGLWAARLDKIFLQVIRRHLALPDRFEV